ncbi:MAG: hypothetical protein EOP09_06145, partial [Proteobacteria bacterium]
MTRPSLILKGMFGTLLGIILFLTVPAPADESDDQPETLFFDQWTTETLNGWAPEVEISSEKDRTVCLEPQTLDLKTIDRSKLISTFKRGRLLESATCFKKGLELKEDMAGSYRCSKSKRKIKIPGKLDEEYARFLSVHFNAAADCLGLNNYRKLLFGEMLKESGLQNQIEGGGGSKGLFQMTRNANEELLQQRNSVGNSPTQTQVSTRLEEIFKSEKPVRASCKPFLKTDRLLSDSGTDHKKQTTLLDRLDRDCDWLNGGQPSPESQSAGLYMGMMFNAYQIARVVDKLDQVKIAEKMGWKRLAGVPADADYCDHFKQKSSCVQVVE